ncbi:hypothetical protein APUTEX25_005401, partial [Auxenochlorella protothecoides]
GTCPETRQEAGNQIVGILRSHPEQLPGVLGAVSALLRSPNWDTRLAAARCLGSAAMHFVHATPADIAAASGLDAVALEAELDREEPIPDGTVKAEQDGDEGPLTLENLDIQEIVDNCPPLLASGGEEYAAQAAEGVAAQRSALRKRLGLGGAAGGFMDDAELFKDEDLLAGAREPEPSAAQPEPAPIQAREGSARLRLASSRRLKGLKRAQGSATGGGLLPPRKSAKLDAGGGGGDQPQAGAPSIDPACPPAAAALRSSEAAWAAALLAGPAAQSCGGGGGGAGGADGAPSRMAPPPALALDLRPYQREGVAWLCFLRATGLHGVLADDMGLGKTVQATAVLALAAAEEGVAARGEGRAPRPSLVLCPATLVAHWPFEIRKALGGGGCRRSSARSGDGQGVRSGDAQGVRSCDGQAAEPGDAKDPTTPAATPGGEPLAVLQYAGGAAERAALRPAFLDPDVARPPDVVVASYETLRADAAHLAARDWLYVVADEGHALGNAAGRVARAACALRAQHRLVLTGTPVQNGVRELWALFDFLMPGFLGTSRAFNAKYGRALQVASRQARSRGGALSSSEAGVLALEGLHRAITPFVLRRTKGQVLTDLPPKVLQDVRCTPTPLQLELCEALRSGGGMTLVAAGGLADLVAALRRRTPSPVDKIVKNLVGFVTGDRTPDAAAPPPFPPEDEDAEAAGATEADDTGAGPAAASPAALACRGGEAALRALAFRLGDDLFPALLRGAGLGAPSAEDGDGAASATPEDAGHRVLIFAQLRASLDLVEACVLAPAGIACARIDGGVDPAERFARAQRFNADPTLGVMLLTTGVGGLGLNLTAADTVVFLEHDWNPMKDMQAGICLTQTRERLIPSPPPPRMHQAMDRAHRLGQRRSVNVYRLILAGTLEEEIMSLQRFKLDVAGAVVNADNASLEGMDAGRVLDLLGDAAKASEARDGGEAAKKKKGGLAGMLAELPDVEEAVDQYAAEFSRPETD